VLFQFFYGIIGFTIGGVLVRYDISNEKPINFIHVFPLQLGCFYLHNLYLTYRMLNKTSYHPLSRIIRLSKEGEKEAFNALGHEYTHHLIYSSMGSITRKQILRMRKFSAFQEGIARGVERFVSNAFSVENEDDVFLFDVTDETYGELKSAYRWLSRKQGFAKRENIIGLESSIDSDENISRFFRRKPSVHAMGNTLFYLRELEEGNQIYRQAWNCELSF